jgi:hypothetical protein
MRISEVIKGLTATIGLALAAGSMAAPSENHIENPALRAAQKELETKYGIRSYVDSEDASKFYLRAQFAKSEAKLLEDFPFDTCAKLIANHKASKAIADKISKLLADEKYDEVSALFEQRRQLREEFQAVLAGPGPEAEVTVTVDIEAMLNQGQDVLGEGVEVEALKIEKVYALSLLAEEVQTFENLMEVDAKELRFQMKGRYPLGYACGVDEGKSHLSTLRQAVTANVTFRIENALGESREQLSSLQIKN